MTANSDPAPARRWDTRRVLYAVLALQLGMAAFLAGRDVWATLPHLALPSPQPQLTTPIAPGDQTRRYAPRDTPLEQTRPGAPERPYRSTGDMPRRLEFLREGDVLRVTGAIEAGDGARFAKALEGEKGVTTLRLNSPGGSVQDALEIGRTIRAARLETRMNAVDVCFSACPYVLAGGTERRVHRQAQVGVHQHYFGAKTVLPAFLAVESIQHGQGDVMRFLDDMGVDIMVMQHALATPPDEIYILLDDELLSYRMATALEE
ncbi:ATP-dependent Clp protease proteolytic subunit [Rhodobacteraceae bacterium KMM 6894]|nr:ATP-dependent Clp protease proteolytic subunit [Rhodobacteraceae bacterium KMM 6894]